MVGKIFSLVNRNIWIVVCPIVLDLLALAAGWALAGFAFHSDFSLRVPLEMGLPSISHLLIQPMLANTVDFMRRDPPLQAYTWLIVFLFIGLRCFAQGAYITALYVLGTGGKVQLRQLWDHGRRNMLRFIFYYTAWKLSQTALTLLLAMLFGVVGIFFSLLVFLGLRVLFIYLEYCMVIDGLSFDAAFRRSKRQLLHSPGIALALVGLMYIVTGAISFFLHRIGNVAVVVAGIPAYAYVMTIIQLSFMLLLLRTGRSKGGDITAK